jgi:hypothetical protein
MTSYGKRTNLKNRGTGAGGSNTNKNGLTYESLTDLSDKMEIINTNEKYKTITFTDYPDTTFMKLEKQKLFKYMDERNERDKNILKAHGCKVQDDSYLNELNKYIVILEKKFQQCGGSACEKLQTADFKLKHFKKTFPNYNIVYIYVLSDWFKHNCEAELQNLDEIGIKYFWGNSDTYKDDIINYIVNCK